MTEVRIRSPYHIPQQAAVLGDVPFGELDQVIPTLAKFGLWDGCNVATDSDDSFTARFVHNETGAYLEVQYDNG